jgi:hypothetical protein
VHFVNHHVGDASECRVVHKPSKQYTCRDKFDAPTLFTRLYRIEPHRKTDRFTRFLISFSCYAFRDRDGSNAAGLRDDNPSVGSSPIGDGIL